MSKFAVPLWIIFALFLGACASESEDSRPEICDEVEGTCLLLQFDGENCNYTGPAELDHGPITLIYLNDSENNAFVNLLRHTGDETIQDAIDHIGDEPSRSYAPSWSQDVPGVFSNVSPGTYTFEVDLEPGIHHMICANVNPLGVYFGGGFEAK